MNTSPEKLSATWCPATTVGPSSPISRATTEKMLDSAKIAMPMGTPMASRARSVGPWGRSKRAKRAQGRSRSVRMIASMASSIAHITVPEAKPQPAPPSAGMPRWP